MDLKALESIKKLRLILEEKENPLKVNYYKLTAHRILSFMATLLNILYMALLMMLLAKLLDCICVDMNVCTAI